MSIARDARHVSDQGVTATRQRIEKGRFTDVGTTDQGDDGEHESWFQGLFRAEAIGDEMTLHIDHISQVAHNHRLRTNGLLGQAFAAG